MYKRSGCAQCNNNGIKARTGIYELIEVADTLRG